MNTEEFHRKLTAILSADVQGYSRLMGEDEDSTVRTLTAYRALMTSLIQSHRGHVVDTPGDNLLAEFGSVMDAVRCAVEIQEELRIRNADLPENRKMRFRVGINLGDIIEEGDRIYGDGINVAARVEGLAEGGGICISGAVYDSIRNKLSMSYEFMGEHNVKNIKEPIRIYRIRIEPEAETPKAPAASDMEKGPKTIAVLPFVNLSSDPEQEYFVDGLSEELLDCLSHILNLRVTARTSSFSFKGTYQKVQEIAQILGVEHILEGSVRKAGNALRITAQLIRALDGFHLWSKSYNRELKDIFAVQEDIAKSVANELKIALGINCIRRTLGGTENVEAYEHYLVAQGIIRNDPKAFSHSLKSIDAAIAMDPKFALAWAYKSRIHWYSATVAPANLVTSDYYKGLNAAQKAIELEPDLGQAYLSLGLSKLVRGEFIEAELAYCKGMELTTQSIDYHEYGLGRLYSVVGYLKRYNELLDAAKRNDPLNEDIRAWSVFSFGILGDVQRAEEEYQHGKAMFGEHWDYGNGNISIVRLCGKDNITRNDIVYSNPIFDVAKEYLEIPEKALAELRRINNDKENLSSGNYALMACWAAYFRDYELAMDAVEKGFKIEASGFFFVWLSIMKGVRKLPRFKKFVRDIGLVDYWNKFGWPDICRPVGDDDFECD